MDGCQTNPTQKGSYPWTCSIKKDDKDQKLQSYLEDRGLESIYKRHSGSVDYIFGVVDSVSMKLTAANVAQSAYLQSIIEQNWITMRQNEEIISLLKKIAGK